MKKDMELESNDIKKANVVKRTMFSYTQHEIVGQKERLS